MRSVKSEPHRTSPTASQARSAPTPSGVDKKMRFLLIVVMLLGGCATPQSIVPPERQYIAPYDQESSLATLVGSQEEVILFRNSMAFTTIVDGKLVMSTRKITWKNWSTVIPIQPGLRNITVLFLSAGGYNTHADLQFQAVAGGKYQVRFSSDVGYMASYVGGNTYCDFWIIDVDTQKPVTGIRRGRIVSLYGR